MSLSVNKKSGVKLKTSGRNGKLILAALIIIESVFTFFLYLSLAGKIFAPPSAQSALGVPEQISYQGRLTDTSGNPLGGTGTPYCFRYSIYDDPTVGNKVWPSTTPATSTITVADGVFSDQIGIHAGGGDDLSTLNFMSTSTLYLNVEVNTVTSTCTGTWSNLMPRQQITSAGFAQTAQNIYGNAIRTNVANKVQIGTGAGAATSSVTLLSLDVANVLETVGSSCSNNGTLWYNSSSTKAYVCEGGLIQAISNASTTIAGIAANATSVTAGTVVFNNANGVTFGLNVSTITASVNAAGGGATLSGFEPFPMANPISTTYAPGIGTWYIQPFVAPQALASGRLNALYSYGVLPASSSASFQSNSTGTASISYAAWHSAALYSRGAAANSTQLASFWSNTWSVGIKESVSVTTNGATSVYASLSATLSYIASVGSDGAYTTASISGSGTRSTAANSLATSAISSVISSLINVLSGQMLIPIGFNTSIPAGQYWLGQAWSTSNTTGGTSLGNIWPLVNKVGIYGLTSMPYRTFGNTASNTSAQIWPGAGIYSAVSAVPPPTINFTQIRSFASHVTQYFNIVNITQ